MTGRTTHFTCRPGSHSLARPQVNASVLRTQRHDGGSSSVTSTVGAVLGSFVFFLVAPGAIAGLVPYLLSRWRIQPPLLGVPAARIVGGIVLAIGVAGLVECFGRFALKGHGTPAPIAPPEN